MKNKKNPPIRRVGLYDPYLDVLGGGEQHTFSILRVLADQGYQINIFWDEDLTKEIKGRFSLNFINKVKWLPNIFRSESRNLFNKILRFVASLLTQDDPRVTLKTFDYFFYITDGSYFFSTAKKNFVFAMVPNKDLYRLSLLNRIKLSNYKFISNSVYTQKHLQNWGINSQVIYPYIDDQLVNLDISKVNKQPIILSVGRFFGHLHSKRHAVIIDLYKKLRQINPEIKNFKLILAGGLKEEDKDYLQELKKITNNDPLIEFKLNISLYKLYKLYKLSTYFWHFTGYGVDENKHPELVEHLGIAPLEAMAAGCLTFCYNAGGPKEIIKDRESGFLFNDEIELFNKMSEMIVDENKKKIIQLNAKEYIKKNFSYTVFSQRVKEIIL